MRVVVVLLAALRLSHQDTSYQMQSMTSCSASWFVLRCAVARAMVGTFYHDCYSR
jgi:hypothetical protein